MAKQKYKKLNNVDLTAGEVVACFDSLDASVREFVFSLAKDFKILRHVELHEDTDASSESIPLDENPKKFSLDDDEDDLFYDIPLDDNPSVLRRSDGYSKPSTNKSVSFSFEEYYIDSHEFAHKAFQMVALPGLDPSVESDITVGKDPVYLIMKEMNRYMKLHNVLRDDIEELRKIAKDPKRKLKLLNKTQVETLPSLINEYIERIDKTKDKVDSVKQDLPIVQKIQLGLREIIRGICKLGEACIKFFMSLETREKYERSNTTYAFNALSKSLSQHEKDIKTGDFTSKRKKHR